MWELDFTWEGFQWLEPNDNNGNTVAFLRKDKKGHTLVFLCNFSPVHRTAYHVGVPFRGTYQEVFNTDAEEFGGRGRLNTAPIQSIDTPCHGQSQQIAVDIPPMGAVVLKCVKKKPLLNPKKAKASTDKEA